MGSSNLLNPFAQVDLLHPSNLNPNNGKYTLAHIGEGIEPLPGAAAPSYPSGLKSGIAPGSPGFQSGVSPTAGNFQSGNLSSTAKDNPQLLAYVLANKGKM